MKKYPTGSIDVIQVSNRIEVFTEERDPVIVGTDTLSAFERQNVPTLSTH